MNFANYPEPDVDIISKNQDLKGVEIYDTNIKPELPINVTLDASEYVKIKTNLAPRVEKAREPIEEFTLIGWTIISPGAETNMSSVYLTWNSSSQYD